MSDCLKYSIILDTELDLKLSSGFLIVDIQMIKQ